MNNPPTMIGVGAATLDIINEVTSYPLEDSEVRALAHTKRLGGNAANTLTVLQQLHYHCDWLGTYADDQNAHWLIQALQKHGIKTRFATQHPNTQTPTSYITLSRETGSRTIIHYRHLPELTAANLTVHAFHTPTWFHFEGREPCETAAMVHHVRVHYPQAGISIEIEKPRPYLERLLLPVTVLIFARAYLEQHVGVHDPSTFLKQQQAQTGAQYCVAPWGAQGAYLVDSTATLYQVPAYPIDTIVDTIAAGDVFNAALIDGLVRGMPSESLLHYANRCAGYKCSMHGITGLIERAASSGLVP
jgi:ketohexokinase